MRNAVAVTTVAAVSLFLLGCNKSTSASADTSASSSTASGSFDATAARAQILGADSAYVRALLAGNLDSLMVYYDGDVVSLGKTIVKGKADLRDSYAKMMKSKPRALAFESGGVNFSDDHSMAWDYGSFSSTGDGPNGKPVKASGTFLNVWKNVGGNWRIVAEISSS